MVLFTLIEIGAQGSLFVLKQTYYLGRYLIWGRQKSREEILEEQLEQQIEKEKELLNEMKQLIEQQKAPKLSLRRSI